MTKNNTLLSAIALLLSLNISTGVHATPLLFPHMPPTHLLLELGGYWRNEGASQFIHINGLIGDSFTVNETHPSNGLVGVGYLVDGGNIKQAKMSYGMNWFYLPKTQIGGTVIQEGLFENLSYGYNVTQYPLYAMAKSTIETPAKDRYFTLNAGIGPNFMTTGQFNEKALPDTSSVPDQIFSGKTTTTFSATAGVGIQFDHALGNAPLECGYQFFYLGEGKLKIINDQVQNTLKTGTLYANAVMCSITL